ncbi:MAG: hypothetical protein J0653_01330 [Deltaproteobacteria bacterium]|nr:hypothetical protein [Deltaproteobacteria bacterium]
MNNVNLYCLLLAASGVFLVYWSKKRSFIRKNFLGVEHFSSFGRKIISKCMDGILLISGYVCIGTAILTLLFEYASEYLALGIIIYVTFLLSGEQHRRR